MSHHGAKPQHTAVRDEAALERFLSSVSSHPMTWGHAARTRHVFSPIETLPSDKKMDFVAAFEGV